MPIETLDVTTRVSKTGSWTPSAGTLVDVLSDASDATYARSAIKNSRVVFSCEDPSPPDGRLVSVCPFVRSKKPGSLSAKAIVCTYYATQIVSRGVYLAIPKDASEGDHELPAHRGCHDLGSVTVMPTDPRDHHPPRIHYLTADDVALGLVDSSSTANRSTVYRAYLKAYYLLAATVDAPAAPTGTIADTQTPTCTVRINSVVESWQVPADEDPWLCEGDVEYRIYAAADVPGGATVPPWAATPVWSSFARYLEMTYGDGTTPSEQDVSAEPDVALENGEYVLFARVSRDVPEGERLYWSDWSTADFTMDVPLPTTPTLTAAPDDAEQRIDLALHVDATAGYDGTAITAAVERSDDGGDTWVTVRGSAGTPVELGDNELEPDYEASRGVALSYRARITDVLTEDASEFSSAWASDTCAGYAVVGWNLKVPTDADLNWLAAPVLRDPEAQLEQPMTIFRPLGRGSAVAVSGASAGEVGTLAVTARSADEIEGLIDLLGSNAVLYVETAYGDAFYARVTQPGWTRAGTLAAPRRPSSLEYTEVGRPAVL